jgi:hypothetical protein
MTKEQIQQYVKEFSEAYLNNYTVIVDGAIHCEIGGFNFQHDTFNVRLYGDWSGGTAPCGQIWEGSVNKLGKYEIVKNLKNTR